MVRKEHSESIISTYLEAGAPDRSVAVIAEDTTMGGKIEAWFFWGGHSGSLSGSIESAWDIDRR